MTAKQEAALQRTIAATIARAKAARAAREAIVGGRIVALGERISPEHQRVLAYIGDQVQQPRKDESLLLMRREEIISYYEGRTPHYTDVLTDDEPTVQGVAA